MVSTLVTLYLAVFAGLVSAQPAAVDTVSANSASALLHCETDTSDVDISARDA